MNNKLIQYYQLRNQREVFAFNLTSKKYLIGRALKKRIGKSKNIAKRARYKIQQDYVNSLLIFKDRIKLTEEFN